MTRQAQFGSSPARRGRLVAAIAVAGLVLATMATGPIAAAGEVLQKGTTYVGTVEGTDAYIGIVVGKSGAFGYVCDGEGITHWLHGSVKKSAVTLTSGTGASVVAKLGDGTLTGKVLLPTDPSGASLEDLAGVTVHDFDAEPATGGAGLYRQEKSVDGTTYAAGWVRLPDGSLRGEVTVARPAAESTSTTAVPPVTAAPPVTTPPANPGGVPADVGTTVVGQIAPPDVQTQFPPTPRSRTLTVKTEVQKQRCLVARTEYGTALNAWIAAGNPLSGPIFDRVSAAIALVNRVCGAGSAGV